MPVERGEQVIAVEIGSTGNGRNPMINGGRQPSYGGTSRMNREVHVRICERLGVQFPGATRHCSWATWAPCNGRHGHQPTMETKLEQIAASAVNHLSKSVV